MNIFRPTNLLFFVNPTRELKNQIGMALEKNLAIGVNNMVKQFTPTYIVISHHECHFQIPYCYVIVISEQIHW